jgi:type I restriction enzyme S subunit
LESGAAGAEGGIMRLPPYPKYKPSAVEWLGNVPAHWDVKRLKMAVRLTDKKVEADEENPVPYIGLENIESWTGRLLPINPDVVPTGTANEFKTDHTLFGKLRPYLAKACSPGFDGLCSTELLVLKGVDIGRDALLYSLLSDGFIKLVDASTYGSKMPRASWDFIGNCAVPIAPSDEQRAITDFLDRETARIDTLMAKKRTLIERLKEKRSALISRSVTKGLPPAAARAAGLDPHPRLKPSGIDWLSDVPEHWNVLPFTKYVAEKSDYRGKTPEKTQDGVFLVTAKNVRMGFIDYEGSQEFVAQDEYDEIMRRGLPKKGDILFTTEAPLGNVALVDREDVALAQRVIRFRMKPEYFCDTFALYGMMSDHFQVQLQSLSTGSTAEGLKASKLPILRLVAPPIQEQRVIAEFLDGETAKIDSMVAKVETALERLQEYRTALITAAVTGKIDVRGAVA